MYLSTPGTGLYDNLQKYNLPHPTAVFELSYFRHNPAPFYLLAKELYPGNFRPTPAHFFIRLLHERACLLRNLTQNIDGLECEAGLPLDHLVQAHGGFGTAACIDCKLKHDESYVKEAIFNDRIPRCTSNGCDGLVKPSIVFFGESLPSTFFQSVQRDLPNADLLIVMGSSLTVQPFASLITRVAPHVPRILINREAAGESDDGTSENEDADESDSDVDDEKILSSNPHWNELQRAIAKATEQQRANLETMLAPMRARLLAAGRASKQRPPSSGGFNFRGRDIFLQGDCDSGVRQLAALIGRDFADRLEALIALDRTVHPIHAHAAAATNADQLAAAIVASVNKSSETVDSIRNDLVKLVSPPTAAAAASDVVESVNVDISPIAVGFDFDHTLGLDHGLELRALKDIAGEIGCAQQADTDSFQRAMAIALKQFRDGQSTQLDLMTSFRSELDAESESVESLQSRWQKRCFQLAQYTTPIPGALELLQWLRAEHIPYAILTNGWSPLQQKKVAVALGELAPSSDAILVSDQIGACKPSIHAFQSLMQCNGFISKPKDRIWYIGDNPAGDCGGAIAAGIKTIFFDAEGIPYPHHQLPPNGRVNTFNHIKPILQAHIHAIAMEKPVTPVQIIASPKL
jgi:NAD-dependent SIR2 family protein deacetylase/FMN phosphatase YigB (HAD superfamily)